MNLKLPPVAPVPATTEYVGSASGSRVPEPNAPYLFSTNSENPSKVLIIVSPAGETKPICCKMLNGASGAKVTAAMLPAVVPVTTRRIRARKPAGRIWAAASVICVVVGTFVRVVTSADFLRYARINGMAGRFAGAGEAPCGPGAIAVLAVGVGSAIF